MGAFKKETQRDIKRAARLVIDKYLRDHADRNISKSEMNTLVKRVMEQSVPLIMDHLRGFRRDNQPGSAIQRGKDSKYQPSEDPKHLKSLSGSN